MTVDELIRALQFEADTLGRGDCHVMSWDGSNINEVYEKYGAVVLGQGSKISKSEAP